jgi:hypothetical protein
MVATAPHDRCADCRYFRNDPAYLEAALPGLASLSSAYASVRDEDGICARQERYVSATAWCGEFRPRRRDEGRPP